VFKAIVTGDIHYRGTNPRARLDNFQDALEEKLSEVFALARHHNAQAIICPGDVFDGPSASWGTVARLTQILRASPCPILAINGNHDIFGGNQASRFRTPYGFLVQTGFLWDVEDSEFTGEVEKDGQIVLITGCGFDTNTDTKTPEGMQQFSPRIWVDGAFQIHVVHSMLLDRDPGFDMRHTLISQVQTSAQVIISGHEHTGFGIVRREDGVLFINPGALCRLSAHVAEIERPVQVALLTVENGQATAELIPLKSARPGHEVLSREHIEAAAERESRIEEFLKLLASEGEAKFLEVREIVEDIAARDNIPADVKQEALRRIGEAREKLGVVTNDL
jgi:exonuclease SbcD